VTLGPDPEQVFPIPLMAFVHGQGIDSFLEVPYGAIDATTEFVFGKKQ
jgi:hypothetical protein